MKEGWEYKKLGECLSYIKNGANIKQTKGAKGIPITRIETLSGGVFNRDRLGYADIFTTKKYSQYIMDDGDILMSHINSKAYIGRAVLYRKEDNEQIIHGMNLLRLKVIPSLVHSNYLNLLFKSYYFRDRVAKIRKDAVNQSSMAISDLVKIPILISPLAEQERIVAEMDLLSSIIDKKKAQLKELDQLAQSIFYDMFGDPITNEKGWEVKKLSEVSLGKLSYGSGASSIPFNNDVRYIRITDINDNGELNEDTVSPNVFDEKYLLNEGDILFARSGATVGKTYCHKNKYGKCIYAGYLIRLIPNKEIVNPLYVFGYTKTSYYMEFVKKAQNAVAQPNINAKQYGDLQICVPPLPLQQEFAEKIEAIERQKSLIQQSIDETQTLFDSRMDHWFG